MHSCQDHALLDQLAACLTKGRLITDPSEVAPYLRDWRNRPPRAVLAVLLPRTTDEVSALLAVCDAAEIAVIPQGGNTGLCGAAVPEVDRLQVIVNLKLMNVIREVDLECNSVTVEAGCILQTLKEFVERHHRYLPLELGAQASCQIGGNLATNAGGMNVVRYGALRNDVLGLEVVLPTGRIWNGLSKLHKDNTGYDVKNLFVGSEGTLGIITAAVLKLHSARAVESSAMVASNDLRSLKEVFVRLRDSAENELSSFELLDHTALQSVINTIPGVIKPFGTDYAWYALLRLTSSNKSAPVDRLLENFLLEVAEQALIADAAIPQSEGQCRNMWLLREGIGEAEQRRGPCLKFDVSVPPSCTAAFIEHIRQQAESRLAIVRFVIFGHMGDGNVHLNVSSPVAGALLPSHLVDALDNLVYCSVRRFGGSISAEHGIGVSKRDYLRAHCDAGKMEIMTAIKRSLDPRQIMNPGKILDLASQTRDS